MEKEKTKIMYKKVIISFLLLAFINFIAGCYSLQPVTVNEYKQLEEDDDKQDEIYVTTKDGDEYYFAESNFYFENDTLYGKASFKELPFEGKIAFVEIESIQLDFVGENITSLHSVSQYQKIVDEDGKPDEIYLTKLDSSRYRFMKNDYHIENDTLYGKGKLLLGDVERLQVRKIAISNIAWIEVDSINWLTTSLFTLGILVGAFILFLVIAYASGATKHWGG
jgi:hypothetical protein